jgi:hypothetical protein
MERRGAQVLRAVASDLQHHDVDACLGQQRRQNRSDRPRPRDCYLTPFNCRHIEQTPFPVAGFGYGPIGGKQSAKSPNYPRFGEE